MRILILALYTLYLVRIFDRGKNTVNSKTSMIIVVLLLCLTLSPSHLPVSVAAQAEPYPYRYAYISHTAAHEPLLHLIDPTNPQNSTDIPISQPSNIYKAFASPDGRWIAIIPSYIGIETIRLMNLVSGETFDIEARLSLSIDMESYFTGYLPRVMWSPDSRFFAFIRAELGQNVDAVLVDVNEHSLQRLTDDADIERMFAWSPDASKLAVFKERQVDIFAISDTANQLIQTILLTSSVGLSGGVACQPTWSPDSAYLVLMSSCDQSNVEETREIYGLDIAQAQFSPLTSYTQTAIFDPNAPIYYPIRMAFYDMFWDDSQTLLIGATILDNVDQSSIRHYRSETIAYHIATHTSQVLLNQEHGREWVKNPVSGALAYFSAQGDNWDFPSVQIANLTNNGLEITQTLPAGCNLAWSPDGLYLAYINNSATFSDCRRYPSGENGLTIFNSSTQQALQYQIPMVELSYPVGWVLAE